MTTDSLLTDVLDRLARVDWPAVLLVAVPAALALVVVFALTSEKKDRRVALIATTIGLTWMAQGMWQAATTVYHVPALFAGVLFLLFETFMLSAMLRANRFRTDHERRARPVHFVWSLAVIGGTVVALAEGWHQAPLRFVVPLLVAWNWHLDLTGDDDPESQQPTSWRWTPRRLLLAIGALEPGARDAVTIDRERLTARMTMLSFRRARGDSRVSDLLRRDVRLAKLALSADDAIVADMHTRLARADGVLKPPPPPKPKPALEIPRREIVLPPREGTQGVHVRDGQVLRGTDLKADALVLMWSSMSADRPRGMTIAELSAHYDPPLKQRTAESLAAEARRTNGHDLTGRQ
jgi:hypothetical protein